MQGTIQSPKSWDSYFLELATTVATKSKDPSTKVGAVIADIFTHEILSTGYNGFPTATPDLFTIWSNREKSGRDLCKYDMVVHAEMNAILHCNRSYGNLVLYSTHPPCLDCAKHIIAFGISHVVCLANKTIMDLNDDKVRMMFELSDMSYQIFPLDFLNSKV